LIVVQALHIIRARVQKSEPAISVAAEADRLDHLIPNHLHDRLAGLFDPLLNPLGKTASVSAAQTPPRLLRGRVPADEQRNALGQRQVPGVGPQFGSF
jgi:hypothetical protein